MRLLEGQLYYFYLEFPYFHCLDLPQKGEENKMAKRRRKTRRGRRTKSTRVFLNMLGLVSLVGFSVIILDATNFTNLNLGEISSNLILVIFGVALLFAGQISKLTTYPRGGITGGEALRILSIVVGIIAAVIGVLGFFPIALTATVNAMKIIIALIAIGLIIFQLFLANK